MTHETLDETIDRVAGEMTTVADDPALTAPVRERMDARRRVWLMPTLAAASVAGVVVIAVALWPRAEQIQAPPRASHELAGNVAAPTVEGGTPVPPQVAGRILPNGDGGTSAPPQGGRIPPNVEGGASVPPHITSPVAFEDAEAETTGPAPLAIAELTITPMAGPDAVVIAPLDVAPLHLPELDTIDESREPR